MQMNSTTIAVLATLFFSTLTRSTFGFGDALIAMPLLAIMIGMRTATPLVALIASTIGLTILIGNWRRIQFQSTWRLILSTIAGIPVGLLLLDRAYENVVKIGLSLIIVSFSLYNLFRPRLTPITGDGLAFPIGFLGGILGGAYNTNGPPIVIYGTLKQWPADRFRATLQGYFFPTSLFILGGHWLDGLWTPAVLRLYLFALPIVLLGILVGGRLNRSIPTGRFDRYVHILLIVLGVVLLINAF